MRADIQTIRREFNSGYSLVFWKAPNQILNQLTPTGLSWLRMVSSGAPKKKKGKNCITLTAR
jgi:hypothetical protein